MGVRALLDDVLDRCVVPGFSRLGYLARRPGFPPDPPADALRGRGVAVTGANSGLGEQVALGAARLGADVRLLCRDLARGESAADRIRDEVPSASLTVDHCDLADLGATRELGERLAAELPSLHALVHNAGALPAERAESVDGHELTVSVHVLGPRVLSEALRPLLTKDGDGRVIFVSSGGMYTQALPVDDWEYARGRYRGAAAYARSKRMQIVLAERLARELSGVTVAAMHPGWAATPGVQDSLPGFGKVMGPILRTPAEGADTTVWLLTADVPSGKFWHDRRARPTSFFGYAATSEADAEALWDFVLDATAADRQNR